MTADSASTHAQVFLDGLGALEREEEREERESSQLRRFDRRWRDACVTWHPGWQHRFWDNAAAEALLEERYAWFLPTFRAYPRVVHKGARLLCPCQMLLQGRRQNNTSSNEQILPAKSDVLSAQCQAVALTGALPGTASNADMACYHSNSLMSHALRRCAAALPAARVWRPVPGRGCRVLRGGG